MNWSNTEHCTLKQVGRVTLHSALWPFPAGPVHLNVTRNAVPIDFDAAYEADVFETRDGWEFVTPDAAAAIGTPHPNP